MSAEWRADDAPAYPQTDEEAELLKLEAEGTRLVLAYADGEIDLDCVRACCRSNHGGSRSKPSWAWSRPTCGSRAVPVVASFPLGITGTGS